MLQHFSSSAEKKTNKRAGFLLRHLSIVSKVALRYQDVLGRKAAISRHGRP